ncbi:general substrate transporter [Coemansia reversa NRRL 1564]|uniref:General substrate transporter n=1 Tax=Coemansia reversa (strain ATCC 12441 / NRRL 1564) TaxID=763665 RepID=A0A2G5BF93_COERN|nr:general substrate transporter [Coemansia reversa NRRL 1564]|eukprot:PIA17680.1 general substrate transporter [Coemansia reversa NRRL 1564]
MSKVPSHTLGITKYQLFCVLAASISSLNFGWNISATNLPGDIIIKCLANPKHNIAGLPSCLPANDITWGLVVGGFPIGALIGALSCTRFADKYGRKSVLMYSNLISIASAVLYGTAINIPMLAIARIVAGIAQGCANGTFTNYVVEITTPRARNSLGSMTQMSISIGQMLSIIASLGLSHPPLWRILFALTGVISLVNMALLVFCVESPKWLACKGRLDDAKLALRQLRKSGDCTEEFQSLVDSVQAEMGPKAYTASIFDVIRGKTPDNLRHQLVLAVLAMAFQQLSGISGVAFYSTKLFGSVTTQAVEYSIKPTMAQILTAVLAIVGTAATLFGMGMAGLFGRKTLMLFSHGSMALFSVLISVGTVMGFDALAIAMVFAFYSVYLLGPGPLPWVFPGEMTPIYAVSSIVAISGSVGYIGIFTIGMTFAPLLNALGGYTFLIFAATNLLAVVLFMFLLPETKDCSVTDTIKTHSVGIHNVMLHQYRVAPSSKKDDASF